MRWAELDAALAAADWPTALEVAVEGWRARRHPAIADAIDAIGSHVQAAPLDSRNLHHAWLELAGQHRASDLGTLIATLRRGMPRPTKLPWLEARPVHAGWVERLSALARGPDDPRLAAPLVRLVRDAPWSVWGRDEVDASYHATLRLVARIGDTRVVPALEELDAALLERRLHSGCSRAEVAATAAVLRALPEPELSADELDRCRRIGARGDAPDVAARLAELRAMIAADPDDDGVRDVYADTLLSAGDPLGDFVALQLAAARGTLGADGAQRMQRLLREHRAAWLGDLDHVLTSTVFERGTLVEAQLAQNASATPPVWARAATDPRLATVRVLWKGRGNGKHYASFVLSPAMRNLRDVTILTQQMLEQACGAPAPWPFRHVRFDRPIARALERIAETTALPELERVSVPTTIEALDADIAAIAAFRRARPIEVNVTGLRFWREEGALAVERVFRELGPPTCRETIAIEDRGWVGIRAGERGAIVDVVLDGVAPVLRWVLPLVPGSIERVVVRTSRAAPAAVEEARALLASYDTEWL